MTFSIIQLVLGAESQDVHDHGERLMHESGTSYIMHSQGIPSVGLALNSNIASFTASICIVTSPCMHISGGRVLVYTNIYIAYSYNELNFDRIIFQ